jgi:hypothetical protein
MIFGITVITIICTSSSIGIILKNMVILIMPCADSNNPPPELFILCRYVQNKDVASSLKE